MRKITTIFALALLALAPAAARTARAADDASAAPWLGVYTQTVDDQLREAMDLTGEGALVSRVIEGSPADRAGVLKGDIITRFASKPVASAEALIDLVRDASVGQNITLEVRRGENTRVLTAQLGQRPSDPGSMAPQRESTREMRGDLPGERRVIVRGDSGESDDDTPGEGRETVREFRTPSGEKRIRIIRRGHGPGDMDIQIPDLSGLEALREGGRVRTFRFDKPVGPMAPGAPHDMWVGLGRGRLGVQVQDLNAQLGEYFEVPDGRGALVMEVMKDTPAERAGLKAGDVITRVEDARIEDSSDLVKALQGKEGKTEVTLVRKGRTLTLEPELERLAPRRVRMDSEDDRLAPEAPAPGGGDLGDMRDQLRELRQEVQRLRSELEASRRR